VSVSSSMLVNTDLYRVLVRVSAEVTKPYAERGFDGIFTIATELSPMASPAFEPGRPTEQEVLLSRLLEKTLRRSGAVDTESLCLIAAQKVWSVRADVHVLSYDGNLIDASCVAVLAALQHFRKPDTSIEGEVVRVYTAAEREPVPLSILHMPFCITFSFYSGQEEVVLLDTTELEEQLKEGSVTISLNKHGEICQIAKLGGVPVDAIVLLQCIRIAAVKVTELSAFVTRRLVEDAKRRDKGGLIAELSAENAR
jgi:exosome complex component RRP45